MFVRLGSPEFVIRRIAAVHSTYFDGVQIIPEMKGPNSATIQYVGFPRGHRIWFVILGFFRKALEISGAKKVDVHSRFPLMPERNPVSWPCLGIEQMRRQ